MSNLRVDGLVSGLDTSAIIKQLMAVERNPQIRLQQKKSDIEAIVKAYRELNTRFGKIRDNAKALDRSLDWQSRFATSSDESIVSATANSSAAIGSLAFTVDRLAATHTLVSSQSVTGTDAVVADGTDFVVNGTTITAAEYGGGTLDEVVAAINASGAGVSAAAVQVSAGVYRLQLTSSTSGGAGSFSVTGTGLQAALGTFGVVSEGADALITVGNGPGAYQVTSTTNTFSGVLPGLTFTANATGAATVTVEADGEALADEVGKLVTALNDAVSYVKTRSGYDQETRKAGIFLGESIARQATSSVMSALIDPVAGSSLVNSSVGITNDRDGNITFDRKKFLEAYAADPAGVEAFFTTNDTATTGDDGIAERLSRMAEDFTRLNTGRIALAIEGRKAEIDVLDDKIANFDIRLQAREAVLRRQFSALETALGSLQQQGQWLAGQLASLP